MSLETNRFLKIREESKEYIRSHYRTKQIIDLESEQLEFDWLINDRNIRIKAEIKERFFITGRNDRYLNKNDMLIEPVQNLPLLFKLFKSSKNEQELFKNNLINKFFTAERINTSIGWFYKCLADRLIYFRYLNNELYDVMDIDFKEFKPWVLNNISHFELQYSDKTTGTPNYIIPFNWIPKPFYYYKKFNTKS